MNNNDILLRIRDTFGFTDDQLVTVFAEADASVTPEKVSGWLKRDHEPAFVSLGDAELAAFLDGLIIQNRGPRDGPLPALDGPMTNNVVLRKLKIALDLQNDDIMRLLTLTGVSVRKPELTALFRKVGHKHYRECHDDLLRSFLEAVQLEYQVETLG